MLHQRRLAFDMFREEFEFPHLEAIMPLVDALDSGGISLTHFWRMGHCFNSQGP